MLTELFVKNFALIEEVRLNFKEGFTVISGETGAGKSILVGAMGFITGGRASPSIIRAGADEAVVESVFEIPESQELLAYLEETGLKEESQLLIRRHVSAQGRHKIFINGRNATLAQLEKLSTFLLDLSGQHDQQILLHEENHRSLLDANPSIQEKLKRYQALYSQYEKGAKELAELRIKENQREQTISFLTFQIEEIRKAQINDEDEEEKLLAEKGRVKNADFLFSLSNDGSQELTFGKDSISDKLSRLESRFQKALTLDPLLNKGLELLVQAKISLEELGAFLSDYQERLSVDPGRLDQIESRLYQFHQLKRKYGASLGEIKQKFEVMVQELNRLTHYDELLQEKEKEVLKLSEEALKEAKTLSLIRKKQAAILEEKVQKELKSLSMPTTLFKIGVYPPQELKIDRCGSCGYDEVRCEIAPNPGEGFKPLSKIASGGELSRILLAIKQVLGERPYSMTMIFDEVDTGIGGAVAEVVGKKLKKLSEKNQVICVTHLPQVAAHASDHFVIEKEVKKQRTHTLVRSLENSERESEIARMLGGEVITAKTKDHAKEMLKTAQER